VRLILRYRPEIDGLRAIAVIPVILFHAGFDLFSGGFIGVDVFFVISGFLITSILISEIDEGNFSLARFYERRARRILPALFTMMAVCLPFAWLWLTPDDMKDFSESLIAVSFFSSNFLFWQESGYFDTATELKPLIHTWSLAVEEQYYVFFPLFLMFMWKRSRYRTKIILAIIGVVSLVLAQWGSRNSPIPTFFLLPTRGWELLMGSFVAFYLSAKESQKGNQYLSFLGLLMIGYSIFAYDKETPFPSVYALLPTVGAALIILFCSSGGGGGIHKILSSRVCVGIGLISYSAYLWHQPLIAFSRIRFEAMDGDIIMLGIIPLSLFLAFLTWKYIETPFRSRSVKCVIETSILVKGLCTLSFLFIVIGISGHVQDGYRNYYLANRVSGEDEAIIRMIKDSASYSLYDVMFDNQDCSFWSREVDQKFLE